MKLLILMSLFISSAIGAPVLNLNMAAEGTLVTIWPDHADPNHFYFAPNFMDIAKNKKGDAKFNFTRYKVSGCGPFKKCERGMITTLLVAGYEESQLKEAQAGILKVKPYARFSAIPFISSRVELGKTLSPFIEGHDCSPKAGQAIDEVPCTIHLNGKGLKTLVPYLNDGKVLPFKFIYKIAGVVAGASGEYSSQVLDYGLTVNLGGESLRGHEEFEW